MKRIDPRVTSGTIFGNCPHCGSAYLGKFDVCTASEFEQKVQMKCVDCAHRGHYFYRVPTDFPKMTLRHANSGQLVSAPRKPKAKVKRVRAKKTDVLPGQLSFDVGVV